MRMRSIGTKVEGTIPWEWRDENLDMSTIAGWLEGLGLAQYAPVFAENAIDIDVVFQLTDSDLEKLGVPLGDRKRMLKAIAGYQQSSTPRTPHSEAERRHL